MILRVERVNFTMRFLPASNERTAWRMRWWRNWGVLGGVLLALVPTFAGESRRALGFSIWQDRFATITAAVFWCALSALIAGTFAKLVAWAISEERAGVLWIGSLGFLFVGFIVAARMFSVRPEMTFSDVAFLMCVATVVALLLADLLMFVAFHFDR